jgi:hypothetical protein
VVVLAFLLNLKRGKNVTLNDDEKEKVTEELKKFVEDLHEKLKPFLSMHDLEAHFVLSDDKKIAMKYDR